MNAKLICQTVGVALTTEMVQPRGAVVRIARPEFWSSRQRDWVQQGCRGRDPWLHGSKRHNSQSRRAAQRRTNQDGRATPRCDCAVTSRDGSAVHARPAAGGGSSREATAATLRSSAHSFLLRLSCPVKVSSSNIPCPSWCRRYSMQLILMLYWLVMLQLINVVDLKKYCLQFGKRSHLISTTTWFPKYNFDFSFL
jgi:hypothetical protein